MRYVRQSAAALALTLSLAGVPRISEAAETIPGNESDVVASAEAHVIPLGGFGDDIAIDGVKVVADTLTDRALVVDAVEAFSEAGWPLTNTEVHMDGTRCDGVVGFSTRERGHHLVVVCTDAKWVLLHELGHVWLDLYLDESERSVWLERRGLDSWNDGPWERRGAEHAADIVAFGLNETLHVPRGIGVTDYDSIVSDFEWLFGVKPVHLRQEAEVDIDAPSVRRLPGSPTVDRDGRTVPDVRAA